MLYEFIATHREVIIARTREKIAARSAPRPTEIEIAHGVPLFLDQLAARLRSDDETSTRHFGESASRHGGELLDAGLTIGQVVHDYGNVCQAITELAVELKAQITNEDFRTLNMCLDVAIADAVTEYARQSDQAIVGRGVEQLAFLAHELRNLLNTATLAFDAIHTGGVASGGSTASVVANSLAGMRDLVTRSLAEVRLEAGPPREERIPIASLLEEIEIAAAMQAKNRDVRLSIERVEADVAAAGDSQILASIVTNLVQNACKFTRAHGHVTLRTRVTPDRVLIDVADECGGLPPGKAEDLFKPYEQRSTDRSGLGLGLTISLKGARAIGGDIHVRNVPGTGCVFTVDLRKSSLPRSTTVEVDESKRRVLIVDDNEDAALMLATYLAAGGHATRVAHNGPQALRTFDDFQPHVVLLDIGLPVMDGFEVAQHLRARVGGARPRIIALTGYGQEADRIRSRDAGFDAHLVKPVDLRSLKCALGADEAPSA